MRIKKIYIRRFLVITPIAIAVLVIGIFIGRYLPENLRRILDKNILGNFVPTLTPYPSPVLPSATPTPIAYKITINDLPKEMTEGDLATFTWYVDGPATTIHKSTVYFGLISEKGSFPIETAPSDTKYSDSVKDFLRGDYAIPMTFVGNVTVSTPGTYYARAYAFVDGKNYWSGERSFTVNAAGYEIKIIDLPSKVKLNDTTTFTWDISGPEATAGFIAVVGAKESKPGPLSATVDLSQTPYKVLVEDFTSGVFQIPLRYVGNAVIPEYGVYYIRVLAVVNGKNIWSDEYTLSVE